MTENNPDPTDASSGAVSPEPVPVDAERPKWTSKSSTAWVIVAGLAVAAATLLIYLFLSTSSSEPDAAPTPDAAEPSAEATDDASQDPPQDATAQSSAARELTPEQEAFLLDLQRRDADDVMALGDVDAPVVLIDYSDFRCSYCAAWAINVKPELQSYLDDGTLRIEYHDLALLGPESAAAAVAARAAGEQGKYWEYHDALFAATAAGEHPDMPTDKLIEMATEIGVPDLDAFEAGLESAEFSKAVEAQTATARELGITSTPTFLINTAIVQGAQSAEVFIAAVESQAEEAKK